MEACVSIIDNRKPVDFSNIAELLGKIGKLAKRNTRPIITLLKYYSKGERV
jgi:hypothetical protein